MKKTILLVIESKLQDVRDNDVTQSILFRVRKKFLKRSENEIVLYEMKDYIISQLLWKKLSTYKWLLPLLLESCRIIGEDFDMLDYDNFNDCENYQDVYQKISDS